MAKDPAFLFYSDAFLSGVQDLTMEERGQYITLLCVQHQKGFLTEKMIRICVGNAAADVMAKFRHDENGNFYNERLRIESEKRAEYSEKQRQRADKRWGKDKKDQDAAASTVASAVAMPYKDINKDKDKDVIKDRGLGKGEKTTFVPPSETEVSQYIVSKYPEIPMPFAQKQAEIFINHYEQCSWRYGKQKVPIKDWKRCVPQWDFPKKFKEEQFHTSKHNGKQSFTAQRNELGEALEQSKRNLIAISSGDHPVGQASN